MNSNVHSPTIPYVSSLSLPLNPGQIIRIQGSPSLSPTCFAINLQNGANSEGRNEVALHLSPVFTSPPRLVRNSIQNYQWGPEESHGPHFPFSPGQNFEILILSEASEFKIAVNGQHFAEFRYRLPLSSITHLAIDGDVSISAIKFEAVSGHSPSESKGDIVMPIGFITPDMQRSVTPPPPAYGGPPPPPYGDLSGCMPAYPPSSGQNPYGPPRPNSLYPDTSGYPQPSSQSPSPGSYPPQGPPQGYPSQVSPQGYPSQVSPHGYPTQGPPHAYPAQGPPHAYPAPAPPHGYPSSPQMGYPTQSYPSQPGPYPSQGPYPSSYPYPSQSGPYPGTSVVYPGSEKEKSGGSSFMGPLAAGAAALAGAAGTAMLSGKHGGKHGSKHGYGPASLLTEGASALLGGGGKHGNKPGSGSFLADGAASLLGGGKHGSHSSKSSPIPIGGAMAGGAAALAGAYMLSKSPMGKMLKPKKMKKLYKHKHKGKWKHHGFGSSSSSSSSD